MEGIFHDVEFIQLIDKSDFFWKGAIVTCDEHSTWHGTVNKCYLKDCKTCNLGSTEAGEHSEPLRTALGAV